MTHLTIGFLMEYIHRCEVHKMTDHENYTKAREELVRRSA
jgi:hypothetical protein